jgi:hypothetical protein
VAGSGTRGSGERKSKKKRSSCAISIRSSNACQCAQEACEWSHWRRTQPHRTCECETRS